MSHSFKRKGKRSRHNFELITLKGGITGTEYKAIQVTTGLRAKGPRLLRFRECDYDGDVELLLEEIVSRLNTIN